MWRKRTFARGPSNGGSSAPPLPLTGILQEKIYGHANYPLKLRETKPRPSAKLSRRPRARGVPPSPRTFKIQPIKLFEKLRLASNFPPRHIIGFRDQIFKLRSFARIISHNTIFLECHRVEGFQIFTLCHSILYYTYFSLDIALRIYRIDIHKILVK